MRKKNWKILLVVGIILVFSFGDVLGEDNREEIRYTNELGHSCQGYTIHSGACVSGANVSYGQDILEAYNSGNETAEIRFYIRDLSGIIINRSLSKTESRHLANLRDDWEKTKTI